MRKLPVATLALVALLLAGCVPHDSRPTPEPSPSATPVFASEEDALKAAETAYAEYLRVSDLVAQDGGANAERMGEVVTKEWLPKELDSFSRLSSSGKRQVGLSTYRNISLQQLADNGDGTAQVIIYLCSDSSDTRFLDQSGNDVTPPTRQTLNSTEATFDGDPVKLLLSDYEPWPGESFC